VARTELDAAGRSEDYYLARRLAGGLEETLVPRQHQVSTGPSTLRAAFVGVESHFVYTRSSQFFVDLLRETIGHVQAFASDWRWIHLPLRRHWDLVVFWQHFPEPWEVDALNADNIALVPMYDNCPREEAFWNQYKKCKVICSVLELRLRGDGLNNCYFSLASSQGVRYRYLACAVAGQHPDPHTADLLVDPAALDKEISSIE
jgi:hypothetical protein